jgi:hypothetical protein
MFATDHLLCRTFVPRIRYLGFTTRGKKGPLTTTGDLSACKSKRTFIQLLTVNTRRGEVAPARGGEAARAAPAHGGTTARGTPACSKSICGGCLFFSEDAPPGLVESWKGGRSSRDPTTH